MTNLRRCWLNAFAFIVVGVGFVEVITVVGEFGMSWFRGFSRFIFGCENGNGWFDNLNLTC